MMLRILNKSSCKLKHMKASLLVAFIVALSFNYFQITSGLSIAGNRDGRKLFGGYKITPKFCSNGKNSKADSLVQGPAICMFNHECVERKGLVIGACMDGFLFGTCCMLSGAVETSLANAKINSSAHQSILAELATRGPTIVTSKPQIINNQYFETDTDDSSLYEDESVKHEISNEAVMVSSPSYTDRISSYYHTEAPPTKSSHSTSQNYVTELPNFIQSSPSYLNSDEESHDNSNFIQFSKVPYDHSDISHVPADSDVISAEEEHGISSYLMQTQPETKTTEAATSQKFSKPIFKQKPTQSSSFSTEKYVLVHTITNNKQPPNSNDDENSEKTTKKPSSTNDSIQSILLMLNGTNHGGPEYTIESDSVSQSYSTPSYPSTSMIDYNKYGSSSYYITTKAPERITSLKVPSTSYIYSPNPTRRPSSKTTTTVPTKKTTSRRKTTTTRSVNRVKVSTAQTQKPTTLNVPSTSYVYSPNPITKRPMASSTISSGTKTSTQASSSTVPEKKTSPKPVILVNTQQQLNEEIESNYVVISGGGFTKHQSPTVHITPKPITNLLTSSTMQHLQTKKPPNELSSSSPTERPPYYGSTTPATFISSSIYVPSMQDFHNEGYFAVVTHRPGVSSTAIYALSPSGILHQNDFKHPDNEGLNDPYTPVISNDDFSNFPPVRNPNLNMTATNNAHPVMDESEISTPAFIVDSQLNSKIDLLVNKLMESLNGNVDTLVKIVNNEKNLTSIDIIDNNNNKKKNGTLQTKPTAKPQKTTAKVTTTLKPPQKTQATAPPGRPSSTTKKTPAKISTAATTKKPSSTKKPATPKPASSSQTTKKPPSRVTTTTKKPTRKATTTKATTTKAPVVDDEQVDEEEGPVEEEGETAEETVEEGEENNVIDESEVPNPPPVENGRVQCGVRPHYKKGRIVGGTAAAFGEFPWQVLVRESTWLGLFTKNKCGGVLISNSYVVTAAHCQPGFLASLVAVFGEYDISGDLETKRSVSKNVKRVIVHRQYDAATFENDLAILELESPVRYDTHIVPICMPPDGADYIGKVATVSGWGRLKYGGGVPSVLQEVQVPIIENTICQDMFEHAGHKKKILPSFLCAGYANGQKDSCEGDSGGPLVLQRPDGRYQLIGTVSHGIKCASPYLPGVYMRTNFYKPWIKSITGIK